MKKIILPIIILFFAIGAKAQNCNFIYNFNTGALNIANFSPNSAFSPNIYHFNWNFGDGTTSTNIAPTHTFNSVAPYYVCYDILDSNNNIVCSSCDSVAPHVPIICSFTATQGAGLDFFFSTPFVAGTIPQWSFDNGITWTVGNPFTYVFQHTGTYNVCLQQKDATTGSILCSSCSTIVVTQPTTNCSFTVTGNPANNFAFGFTAVVPFGSTVTWDFGDNTIGSGAQVSHTYNAVGTFNVCMTSVDPNGGVCTSCSAVMAGSSHGNCFFTFVPDSVANTFLFTGLPAFPGSAVTWDFGDNSVGAGTNVSHTYANNGTYTVCMNEIDSTGTMICQYCDIVTNNTGNCSFTASSNPFHNFTIDFQANSGFFSTVTWDFGDGSTGTGLNPSHTYPAPGVYNVCITVVTPGVVNCTYCHPVTVVGVQPMCNANFIATSLGLTAYFIDLSGGTSANTTYLWDFNDGNTSTSQFPQHVYSVPGTYNVCLTIVSGNCTDTYCSNLFVDSLVNIPVTCQAFFAIVQLAPYEVTVINLSSGLNLSFLWDFGDGSTDTSPFPSHFYSSTGSYNLCVTVNDANGCQSSYCDTLNVDSLGNLFKSNAGFTLNVISPAQLTGVNEIKANKSFSVFPNPVNSDLHIRLITGVQKATSYRVLSLQGSEILRGSLNGFEGKVNMQTLSSGTYLLEVTLSDGSRSYQSVVKN